MARREPLPIEARAARRFAERRHRRPSDAEDPLAREIERRMTERLDYVRLDPRRILDAGCGTASIAPTMRARYPGADTVSLDWACAALFGNTRRTSLWDRVRGRFRRAQWHAVCGAIDALPFASSAFDLLWANLALGSVHDPLPVFREWQRVTRTGGLLMFSTFGPDTLRELRESFDRVDGCPHVHTLIDMHDLGDMLVAAGFAEPVMDMEMFELTYGTLNELMRDLRASGVTNALAGRRRSLLGRGRWQRMSADYERYRRSGRLVATVEIIYGHAWRAERKSTEDGRAIIRIDGLRKPMNRGAR